MNKTVELKLLPAQAQDEQYIRQEALRKLRLSDDPHYQHQLLRKSLDARGQRPYYRLRVAVSDEPTLDYQRHIEQLQPVADTAKEAIIVGAGPAGYFAALTLLTLGIRPIVLDRGKDVRRRRRDLRAIQQEGSVNPDSNYCFGEGGAGTYSDGKLYTRSYKRGNIQEVLEWLVAHGAAENILYDAHPHIGSNKLPKIVSQIRETIETHGGVVHFDSQVTDLLIEGGHIRGVQVNAEKTYEADAVILSTGHSARDIYRLLHQHGIHMEAKPFALGVRVEHPQPLIDQIQYNQSPREEHLPASSYRLACQVKARGVFSFCMCPGGLIVPAATAPGELVVNGMSLSRRDSPFANSGVVTAIELTDIPGYQSDDVFAVMDFQAKVEQRVFAQGDGSQQAPAQRLTDFIQGKQSHSLIDSSYIPGIYSAPVHELLPAFVVKRLQAGLRKFGKRMSGYVTDQAQVIAVESRTSAPIRIPRDPTSLQHADVQGLYPCGEGAGYAGGILSAAMDGQRVARAVGQLVLSR